MACEQQEYVVRFRFDIGDRVLVSGGKQGVVRFLGETEFAQGIWAGIELEQPLGKNDGSVQVCSGALKIEEMSRIHSI